MKTKRLVTTTFISLLGITGLTGCGGSDTAAETCQKIESIQDEHGDNIFPRVSGASIRGGEAAEELDAVYSDWQEVGNAASDEKLSSAMSDMELVFDDYQEYISAYLDEDADEANSPDDKKDNREIAQSSGAIIDGVCGEV
ncbi:hypothetical protein GCM10009720_09560 [Yaniella flava]|uniref:Lipoprotein n=1 Tax=Yaniella flava TaxID=287930 RepID=A0ABN2U895_9MICC